MSTQNTEQGIVFDSIKIGLASPEKIHEWSRGEVKKPETINYRTLKPEKDGLFCERIFGPTKDWECHCGKYKRIRYKGVVCDRCGVEVTKAKVRRERMGHIELAAPVSHIWYFKGIPSRMGLILSMSPRALEKVLYFASYVVLDAGDTELQYKQLLSEREYREAYDKYGNRFEAAMGAEAIKKLLQDIDLEKEADELKRQLADTTGQKRVRIIKKLEVVESFRVSGNKPEWMILDAIPVIPPDIRPMVQLDGGRFATSDLNDLYRRVINRNNRLKRLLDLGAPDIIVRNEKRMLQEAVDALIDNGRRGRPVTGPGNRALKSLSDMLKGKQGRFRQNLLGKRVDYSGRSVIVVGPELKIYQCGLPKEMAIELFKPFVMKKLVEDGLAHNIKSAKRMVERLQTEVWDILEDVIKEHPVMLNRAPTLHRLGIQAFEPVLVEGRAIKLHPLVCTAYNADFDGDQMAVHVPLSVEAQAECRFLLLSPNNLLKPSDGAPVTVPSQDMILGMYYLTLEREDLNKKYEEDILDAEGNVIVAKGDPILKVFKDEKEAMLAYDNHEIYLQEVIKVRRTLEFNGVKETRLVRATVGRIIFNEAIPQNLGYVDRTNEETKFDYEVGFLVDKKAIGKIINKCINRCGATETAEVLDKIKSLGYKFSTRAAMTVSVSDMEIPKEKAEYLAEAEEKVDMITRKFRRGLMTDEERHQKVIEAWNIADDKITVALLAGLGKYNNIYMMANSGARGSNRQIKQLAGMRGLMASPNGGIIELPIKANFREGLSVLEYFISAHGARKGLTDTALKTADSGYLTRRLVDVSQDIIVREWDCCEGRDMETPCMEISAFMDGNEVIEGLQDRIRGRWSAYDIIHPETGEIIVPADTMITVDQAEAVEKAGIKKVWIRTVLTCRSEVGICAKCYGANMASGRYVRIGESVGIIAAQSIGEPGTQLTMRTFHTGGIAGDDITQGLPRVEELFEARKPKGLAIIAEFGGHVTLNDTKKKREVIITNPETGETKDYLIPYGSRIKVYDGDVIEAGDEITEGSVNPHDILKIKGLRGVQDYMIQEVQRVYRLQGVEISDKHIEVIVRQMLKRVKIEENGDTDFLPGSLVDWLTFENTNAALEAEGKEPAKGSRVLLGITKASLATDSFLSAASFQETTRVLTEAAIKGKIDPLIGLKENVIIGKLIPAGTGMSRYRNIDLELDQPRQEDGYSADGTYIDEDEMV
ncbi:DNA-directed RNA polymerase subunit beta' [Anaerotignum lactatifermentans]|uniref:DNA-directed RNA polymerase subunit beta' n=1 Tax=Anaerotignum lactatifermentans TaxID=160404 RepID=A0ABS2G8H3_9FIRM|nr:DNA-directed RNA polymerase subunit beta' [Anaerotignum lactatifermentans]MBM6828741.1 DNA-directed RNA polymerase subunit beta' [Anaerotignum lactatifermentans]MBM6877068.1 DNA-directed RNA polymerase subunit beta' [Anaerotignum lactatifermentans]MBM6950323.1 DNA-directed RNA polymerase subunit beta' [Anaerotignum lactatifermentans]